jgi:hypothetical protein
MEGGSTVIVFWTFCAFNAVNIVTEVCISSEILNLQNHLTNLTEAVIVLYNTILTYRSSEMQILFKWKSQKLLKEKLPSTCTYDSNTFVDIRQVKSDNSVFETNDTNIQISSKVLWSTTKSCASLDSYFNKSQPDQHMYENFKGCPPPPDKSTVILPKSQGVPLHIVSSSILIRRLNFTDSFQPAPSLSTLKFRGFRKFVNGIFGSCSFSNAF